MFDANDEPFVAPEQELTASAPLATTQIALDGTFAIAFVQADSYQITLSCGNEIDDNVQFDGLAIQYTEEINSEFQVVTVEPGQISNVIFDKQ